jgi:hypothetical protein
MQEGLAGDDIWVMVEDEFLATARLFTRHLHHAEYQRLKKLARSQNASAIQNISRAVDDTTPLSIESRKKLEASAQRKQQRNAVTNILGTKNGTEQDESESEEDDPWMRDPRLAGLMVQRENSAQLAAITGAKSKTRASAGYSQTHSSPIRKAAKVDRAASKPLTKIRHTEPHSQQTVKAYEDEFDFGIEEHDPDTQSNPAVAPKYSSLGHTVNDGDHSKPRKAWNPSAKASATGSSLQKSSQKTSRSLSSPVKPSSSEASLDIFDALPKRQALPNSFTERMARRKIEAAKKEQAEKRRRSLKAEEVPTFLV